MDLELSPLPHINTVHLPRCLAYFDSDDNNLPVDHQSIGAKLSPNHNGH